MTSVTPPTAERPVTWSWSCVGRGEVGEKSQTPIGIGSVIDEKKAVPGGLTQWP